MIVFSVVSMQYQNVTNVSQPLCATA